MSYSIYVSDELFINVIYIKFPNGVATFPSRIAGGAV